MPSTDDTETLGSLGEAAVLARIFPRLPESSSTVIGPGDDAAVLTAPDGRVVITTDTMVHGPDFRLAWSSPHDLGWKAAATNLADVAAMGAVPTALVVALAAPADTPASILEGIAEGLRDGCHALAPGCGVVGGDLAVSATLTLAVTAVGDLEGRAPVLRSGARPGDAVAVSGALGHAGRGLALLFQRVVDASGEPDASRLHAVRAEFPELLAAQLAPSPPIADGPAAARAGATAMMDVSDGLVLDSRRIAAASGVVIDLDTSALAQVAGSTAPEAIAAALSGGEDHAMLATFPEGSTLPPGFRVVGRVLEAESGEGATGAGVVGPGVTVDGRGLDGRGGWDPYADWDGSAG